jgi:hypothetical protein
MGRRLARPLLCPPPPLSLSFSVSESGCSSSPVPQWHAALLVIGNDPVSSGWPHPSPAWPHLGPLWQRTHTATHWRPCAAAEQHRTPFLAHTYARQGQCPAPLLLDTAPPPSSAGPLMQALPDVPTVPMSASPAAGVRSWPCRGSCTGVPPGTCAAERVPCSLLEGRSCPSRQARTRIGIKGC